MGLIAKVLSYVRADRYGAKVSDVKFDPGGGANQTAQHFQDPNTDSVPLPGDYVFTGDVQRTQGQDAAGFIDPNQAQTAQPGENRTYARDSEGNEVAQIHIQSDGAIRLSNGAGYINLQADGTVNINGFTIDPTGAAISPVSVTAPLVAAGSSLTKAGVEVADQSHDHDAGTYNVGGSPVTGTSAQSNG